MPLQARNKKKIKTTVVSARYPVWKVRKLDRLARLKARDRSDVIAAAVDKYLIEEGLLEAA